MNKAQTHKQLKELKKLVEQWTRADVMSRVGRFDNLEFLDYARIKLEKEAEIRQLMFGTSEIVELAECWDMIKPEKPNRRKNKKVL